MSTKRPGVGLLAALLMLTLTPPAATGAEFRWAQTRHEAGLRLVYGKNMQDADVRLVGILPRFGWVLVRPGSPWLAGCGLSFVLEGIFTAVKAEKDGVELGLTPLLRLTFPWGRQVLLFVEGGAGVIGEFFDSPAMPHTFNFTPQIGGGVEVAVARNVGLVVSYRYRHSSNAGLYEDNPAFDVHLVQAGVSYYF
jgi:opacity protein-like surface antigen